MSERASVAVSAAQNILRLCSNDFRKPTGQNEARVYLSGVYSHWKAYDKKVFNRKKIFYEVTCRFDRAGQVGSRSTKDAGKVAEEITRGDTLSRVVCNMPPDYEEKLLKVEPRHTARPMWSTFDFSMPVCMLGAWLAGLTFYPNAKLSDMYDVTKIELNVITNMQDTAAISSSAVFISQNVMGLPMSGGYWALVAACGACGIAVNTDRAMVAGVDTPRFFTSSGPRLWRDIIDALRVLAELYDRAGAGEVFAYSFFKGLHTTASVVAHSDEGGLTRDVLRECRLPTPFGGLPACCPLFGGLPTIMYNSTYSALVCIVDSLLLQSAAAVAHCAPMAVTAGGTLRPCVFEGKLPRGCEEGGDGVDHSGTITGKAGTKLSDTAIQEARMAHVQRLAPALVPSYAEFAEAYLPALAKILGFHGTGEQEQRARAWMVQQISSVLDNYANRHLLKDEALAPFFWVEPTTILPRNWLGSPAEVEGWASVGGQDERWSDPMFPGCEETDQPTATTSYYEINFKGARCSPWINCIAGHREDGLAQIHFKRMDPQGLALVGGKASARGVETAFAERYGLHEYLWVRGQSCYAHPAEALYLGDRVVIAVRHLTADGSDWHPTIPGRHEMAEAKVTTCFNGPASLESRNLRWEVQRSRAERTQGLIALAAMVCRLRGHPEVTSHEGGYVRQLIYANKPVYAKQQHQQGSDVESRGYATKTAKAPESITTAGHAAKVAPAMSLGSHTGPRLPLGAAVPSSAPRGVGLEEPIGGADQLERSRIPEDGEGAAGTAPANP